jgi:AcrR family transcriptional regulator
MARNIPAKRFQQLVEAATRIFIAQGYRRTQMADIASAMSLGKGTLYGYVESKAALFLLAVEHCDDRNPMEVPEALPLATPPPGATLAALQKRLAQGGVMPKLTVALERATPPVDIAVEVEGILAELYGSLHANHRGIRMMEACALDHPELAEHWHNAARYAYLELLAAYLDRRQAAGALTLAAEAPAVARFIIETMTTWAVHIHFDASPQALPLESIEKVVMHFLLAGLLGDRSASATKPPLV